ncbi:MAG: sialidase family protein [Pseudomonas oryzihabitans]|uniref:WD40/YVTN/BNR-like repeat-containing protein n=1 Tax=Pseudomonas oryzihabitans TaxID=47885 RepID=UPI0029148A6F|nr:sialidase family protein [Pseudomonas oryzihabitans]MDU4059448.1 sialidase family protein [Pseudomonas oryzihabitans]
MTIPQVTPLPPAPNRRQSRNDYPITADTWAAALGPYTDQLNAFAAELNPLVPSLAAAGPNAARAEAAAQQAQTYAAAAGASAGMPALAGNKGKALVVSQDEKTVQFGDVGQKIGDILITANDPGATYLPANGSVFGQSNFPELFKKVGIIGDTINSDYKSGWNVPAVPQVFSGEFAWPWNTTIAYNGKGMALRVTKVFSSAANGQYFYVERMNFPTDSGWTKVSPNIMLLSSNATYRRASIDYVGGSTWVVVTSDANDGSSNSVGGIWISKDDGATWNIVYGGTAKNMTNDYDSVAANGKGVIVAYRQSTTGYSADVDFLFSEDYGTTWRLVRPVNFSTGARFVMNDLLIDDAGDVHMSLYWADTGTGNYLGYYFKRRLKGGVMQVLNNIATGRTIANSSDSDARLNFFIKIFIGGTGRVILCDKIGSTTAGAQIMILNLANSSVLASPMIYSAGAIRWIVNYGGSVWIAGTNDSSNGTTVSGKWLWISFDDGATWVQMNITNHLAQTGVAALISGVLYFSIGSSPYRLETSTSYDKAINFATPNMQIPAGQVIKAYIKAKES